MIIDSLMNKIKRDLYGNSIDPNTLDLESAVNGLIDQLLAPQLGGMEVTPNLNGVVNMKRFVKKSDSSVLTGLQIDDAQHQLAGGHFEQKLKTFPTANSTTALGTLSENASSVDIATWANVQSNLLNRALLANVFSAAGTMVSSIPNLTANFDSIIDTLLNSFVHNTRRGRGSFLLVSSDIKAIMESNSNSFKPVDPVPYGEHRLIGYYDNYAEVYLDTDVGTTKLLAAGLGSPDGEDTGFVYSVHNMIATLAAPDYNIEINDNLVLDAVGTYVTVVSL